MNAPELIALLRSRPKACGRLGIDMREHAADVPEGPILFETDEDVVARGFLNWLTGAAVNWCDEHGIEVERTGDGEYRAWVGSNFYDHETRLHALLAAIEASEETTT